LRLWGNDVAIVSSVIVINETQTDGSRIVLERHTDNVGLVHEVRYEPAAGVDVNALLAIHAAGVADALVAREMALVLRDG
jgi:hypothetical protein